MSICKMFTKKNLINTLGTVLRKMLTIFAIDVFFPEKYGLRPLKHLSKCVLNHLPVTNETMRWKSRSPAGFLESL